MKKIYAMALAATVLFSACDKTEKKEVTEENVAEVVTEDTAVVFEKDNNRFEDDNYWAGINYEAPEVDDPALKKEGISLRASDSVEIYTAEENLLFDTDKATISKAGEEKLKKISEMIKSRVGEGAIRIYGFTDSRASKEYNMQLSKDRAVAVENWMINNSGLDSSKVKTIAMGEKMPVASNKTAEGRQQNRRVEIVVAKK